MVDITVGYNTLIVYYRLDFPALDPVIVSAEPLKPVVARDVLGNYTESYTMVSMFYPAGYSYPFLAGNRPSVAFLQEHLGVDAVTASLLRAIMPELTTIAPADDIVERANEWYSKLNI